MALSVKNEFHPHPPLGKHLQIHGNRLFFPTSRRGETGDAIEFGLTSYHLDSAEVLTTWAPMTVCDTHARPTWRLLAIHSERLVAAIAFETSYDCNYKFFQYDIAKEHWRELAEYDADNISLDERSRWVAPPTVLDLDYKTLSGGAIHYWTDDTSVHVITDCTHAFEHDNSVTDTDPAYERAKQEHPLVVSNVCYGSLAKYVGYNGEMYQRALEDGTPNLPADIAADHVIRDIRRLHEFSVAEIDHHVLFIRDDFRAGGITEILQLTNT